MKLSSLGTLACLVVLHIIDHSQLDFTQADARPPFSQPNDSQDGAMALLEVPLFVATLTVSLPILPLIQYCVGTQILSYYTSTIMCEGMFGLLTSILHLDTECKCSFMFRQALYCNHSCDSKLYSYHESAPLMRFRTLILPIFSTVLQS